jgi:uncharacterized protein YjbJ (UPF0337 family)
MNRLQMEGAWHEFLGRMKLRWGRLVHDDFATFDGRREAITGRMQKRYGISNEEARRRVNEWIREPGVLDDWNDTRSILDL